MVRPIMRDMFFLSQPSFAATREDMAAAKDLLDTLKANEQTCVGMAANMIGVRKRLIAVNMGLLNVLMINPVILQKEGPFTVEEGCLSLDGKRTVMRYHSIRVEYRDSLWKKRQQSYTGWTAQIIQHEIDHLEGILI